MLSPCSFSRQLHVFRDQLIIDDSELTKLAAIPDVRYRGVFDPDDLFPAGREVLLKRQRGTEGPLIGLSVPLTGPFVEHCHDGSIACQFYLAFRTVQLANDQRHEFSPVGSRWEGAARSLERLPIDYVWSIVQP